VAGGQRQQLRMQVGHHPRLRVDPLLQFIVAQQQPRLVA
jgi:hypothetical protein